MLGEQTGPRPSRRIHVNKESPTITIKEVNKTQKDHEKHSINNKRVLIKRLLSAGAEATTDLGAALETIGTLSDTTQGLTSL